MGIDFIIEEIIMIQRALKREVVSHSPLFPQSGTVFDFRKHNANEVFLTSLNLRTQIYLLS
jgi:hypothetical protein